MVDAVPGHEPHPAAVDLTDHDRPGRRPERGRDVDLLGVVEERVEPRAAEDPHLDGDVGVGRHPHGQSALPDAPSPEPALTDAVSLLLPLPLELPEREPERESVT